MEEKPNQPPKAAAAAAGAPAQPAQAAAPPKLEAGARVGYVKDRPYVAGEAPEVVEATVTRVGEGEVVDLEYQDGKVTVEKRDRARSDRRDVGTWHWPALA